MKKVHAKLNKMLAVSLSALMVCLSLPGDQVLADTVSQGDSAETVTENTIPDSGGETESTFPGSTTGEMENVFPDGTEGETENVLPDGTEGETENVLPDGTEGETENVLPDGTEGETENALSDGTEGEAGNAISDSEGVSTPTESETADTVSSRDGSPYIFAYDGETATEGVLDLSRVDYNNKTGALQVSAQNVEKQIPLADTIAAGTVVFDMEFCPMGKCKESVVFANSKGETLFAVCVDAVNKKVFLCDTEAGTELVNLGGYTDNSWCRVRTELYFDESQSGELQFKVIACDGAKNTYDTYNTDDNTKPVTVTQSTLVEAGGANGTVSAADGSTDHPFDLGSITIYHAGNDAKINNRAFGDMFLYAITNVELTEQPGEQTAGADFVPGDAAVEVTYSTGAKETIKLVDLLCGVDYTAEANEAGKYVICYGGKEFDTTAEVPAAIVTGIQIKSQPTKTIYAVGEKLDMAGLEVEAVKSDGTTVPLTENDYMVSDPDMSTAGLKEIIVTYKENTEITTSFKVRVESGAAATDGTVIFAYKGDAISLEELGLTDGAGNVELSTTPVAGSSGQNLAFTKGATVTKSWEALNTGTVKINVEFNQVDKNKIAHFRIYDGKGNLLINFIQQKSGNVNLYKNTDTQDKYETVIEKQIGVWVRLETEIDLTASNAAGKLIFTTKSFYKKEYTDAEWIPGKEVSNANYEEWEVGSGCASPDLTEFSVGSLAIQGGGAGVAFSNIEVLVPAAAESQSFMYIDAEDITDLELEASGTGVLNVNSGEQEGNTTNKLSITGGSVTKTLKTPISSGKVSLETVGYHNGNVLGVQILDGNGKNLITYSQQTSGNLNLYGGNIITGNTDIYDTVASKDIVNKKWVKVRTEIDLDESNRTGILDFAMTIEYKDSYTDEEWKPAGTATQQVYIDKGKLNGAADDSLTSFDIGAIKIGNNGSTVYVDDIKFDDGNGIEGNVTITEKVLKSIEITTEATTKEFPQDSKISTEGLVLTGTYDVTYSDGRKEEKTYKITKYDVECDTSKIADVVPVIIKVTDNGKEFTATYNVKIVAKPDGSYVTFSYTDESGVAHIGFTGSKISVVGGDVSGNDSNKIKLDKGDTKMTLAAPCTTGTVHFETEFLTTATSKASLFLRLLNSEGKPMVDIAQYGSGNLNLYIDKKTSGTDGAMAGQFGGLPVKQWAKMSVDIDLDQTKEQGHLVFDAIVWTKEDYDGEWTVHAEYNQDLYLNSTMAPTTTGSASTDATVFDVAAIEMVNSNGTNYYDNMFFEAIRGDVTKELVELWIEKPAEKTDYTVGDSLNRAGLVLRGKYKYTFPNGDTKEKEAEVTKYDISFDNTEPGEEVPVYLTAEGKTVSYTVTVRPNTSLDDIEEYLVNYINNKLVNLDGENVIHINKRQVRLPIETAKGEGLGWEVASGNADVTENVLTVIPSTEEKTEVVIKVTLSTINNDGDPVSFSKMIKLSVPRESGKAVDDSLATEESIRYAITTLYERGLLDGQANLADIEAVVASLDRDITTEEIAVILVNMFDIDTTYADTKISRKDVEDDAWYSKHVKAAFQLSVETRDSHEGKEYYGIGKGVSRNNLTYMINRIVHIDQTTMPSDYADRMFE